MPAQDVAGGVALAAIALAGGSVGFVLLSWLPALDAARGRRRDARRAQLADGGAALTTPRRAACARRVARGPCRGGR